jgi:hypothetical protein
MKIKVAGATFELFMTPRPEGKSAVRLTIVDDVRHGHKNSMRGSGMSFNDHDEVRAAIAVLRSCLPVVDQLGSIADE